MTKVKVRLSASVKNDLIQLVENNYKYEICGILIGKFEDRIWDVTNQVYDQKNVVSSKIGTVRSTKNVWDDLNITALQNNDVDYIGEWHTHIVDMTQPSNTDMVSMMSIIGDKYYGAPKKVLLLIITADLEFHFWHFDTDNVYRCKSGILVNNSLENTLK